MAPKKSAPDTMQAEKLWVSSQCTAPQEKDESVNAADPGREQEGQAAGCSRAWLSKTSDHLE
jgi:hypothetical protein